MCIYCQRYSKYQKGWCFKRGLIEKKLLKLKVGINALRICSTLFQNDGSHGKIGNMH